MEDLVIRARQSFADRHPNSRRNYDEARRFLPGGHTRTVLAHAPFPLTFVSGREATLTDADGHEYIDFLGDYTAGLLGHSERRVLDAVTASLESNASVGGIHPAEARLARLMCERFDIERVRFTNSGTEANLMAITTALTVTGRSKIVAFIGGYHGGVLYFASGPAAWNAPYDFVLAPYNDLAGARTIIEAQGSSLAAVILEPMLGSGGCVPASADFVRGVADAARKVGALVIADEVMTSRHGRRGMMNLLGVRADITTFGKYIGGGFSFGAFGGSAECLDVFDTSPEGGRANVVSHAGTFNNNLATMTAGCVVLGDVFTADVAEAHTARGNEFRAQIELVLAAHRAPLSVTGFGSMMSLHGIRPAPTSPLDVGRRDNHLNELVFLGLLERGVYTAARGMMNLGLAHTDDQMATVLDRLDDLLGELDAHF